MPHGSLPCWHQRQKVDSPMERNAAASFALKTPPLKCCSNDCIKKTFLWASQARLEGFCYGNRVASLVAESISIALKELLF